jgi:hypothetical protein
MVTEVLLKKAPASLLRRTGIDELLFKVSPFLSPLGHSLMAFQALQNALQNLTSNWSPDLLRAAMPCYLSLVDLVLPDGK